MYSRTGYKELLYIIYRKVM